MILLFSILPPHIAIHSPSSTEPAVHTTIYSDISRPAHNSFRSSKSALFARLIWPSSLLFSSPTEIQLPTRNLAASALHLSLENGNEVSYLLVLFVASLRRMRRLPAPQICVSLSRRPKIVNRSCGQCDTLTLHSHKQTFKSISTTYASLVVDTCGRGCNCQSFYCLAGLCAPFCLMPFIHCACVHLVSLRKTLFSAYNENSVCSIRSSLPTRNLFTTKLYSLSARHTVI